ncbi:ATPase, T2SS/T4P/T4SS family [candidate division CSSED10-310 bacterium]|uniref:ATPase, T2SS/T4P/T4SS family n=1 Tax=candidate division CSSED10-310 bacterium TaxID=2855610 RepID=A0ABV6Z3F4_UNCC1
MKKEENQEIIAGLFARTGRLLSNGVPLISALEVIAVESDDQPEFQKILWRMCRLLEIGKTFSDSMKGISLFTDSLMVAISAGETQGVLDETLLKLSQSVAAGDFPIGELPDLESLEQDLSAEMTETIPNLVDKFILKAFQAGASDLHIDPERDGSRIRFRIDGLLHTQPDRLSKMQHNAVVSRIKIMAALDPAERKLPQDGRIITAVKRDDKDDQKCDIDLRVACCPYVHGEKIVIRFLDQSKFPTSLEAVITGEKLLTLRKWLQKGYGLILVTGPTGSGKTTTLYLMLQEIAAREGVNVLTVEDPVEFLLTGTNQMQIQPSVGLTFSTALHSMLRQDPDVICVGEIREPEIAKMISKIALVGHLVLSQLHTHDSISTIDLLTEVDIPAYVLRQILIGIVSQRLVRKLCKHCKQPLTKEEQNSLPTSYQSLPTAPYKAVGCDTCAHIGYKGRLAIYEVFEPDNSFWKALTDGESRTALKKMLANKGITLLDHGLQLVAQGLTSVAEIERALVLS